MDGMTHPGFQKLLDENTRLRAALAVSKDPCAYCQLPAEEMAKCKSGFPGCARADDMSGCPEFGASLNVAQLQKDERRLQMKLRLRERDLAEEKAHVKDLKQLLRMSAEMVQLQNKRIAELEAGTEGDACQMCLGAKGGVPGNENRIGDVIMCDYCHALYMNAKQTAGQS